MRPRPHGASVLIRCMSTAELSEHWIWLLSGDALGVGEAILLDRRDVRVGPQNLQVSVGKNTSETVDDVPFVRDLGLGADLAGDRGDTSRVWNTILKSYDVTPGNSVLGPRNGDEGGRSGEDRENTEEESDELFGEHGGCSELAPTNELRLPRRNSPHI